MDPALLRCRSHRVRLIVRGSSGALLATNLVSLVARLRSSADAPLPPISSRLRQRSGGRRLHPKLARCMVKRSDLPIRLSPTMSSYYRRTDLSLTATECQFETFELFTAKTEPTFTVTAE